MYNKKIATFTMMLVLVLNVTAQLDGWIRQTGGTGKPNNFHFRNKNLGWVVGETGTIVKTKDGGINWISQKPPADYSSRKLRSIYFVTDNKGFIAGNSGTVLQTSDGGETWSASGSKLGENLNAIHFFNESLGWVLGDFGSYSYTTDGGKNWSPLSPFGNTTMTSIYFINAKNGWAGGSTSQVTRIYATNDGGLTWELQKEINRGSGNSTVRVQFVSTSHGWASDGDELFYTTDGGDNWQAVSKTQKYPAGGCFYFLTKTKGFSLSGFYEISKFGSTDNGVDFTMHTDLNGFFSGLQMFDENEGIALHTSGYLRKTSDGGKNWTSISVGYYGLYFSKVKFINDRVGIVLNGNRIFKTENGGGDWAVVATVGSEALSGIQVLDAANTYVWSSNRLWHSSDFGNTWSEIHEFESYLPLRTVCFIDKNKGLAFGDSRRKFQTSDGGKTWTNAQQSLSSGGGVNLLYFINENQGLLIGTERDIYYTQDGGETWVRSDFWKFRNNANGFLFLNDTVGYCAANYGVYITKDAGMTWNQIYNSNNFWLKSVAKIDDSTLIATGQSTVVSADTGSTWKRVSGAPFGFSDILGNDVDGKGSKAWIAGSNGNIYHWANKAASLSTPQRHLLLTKVFPNPTENVINIEIPEEVFPKMGEISIEVIDFMGNLLMEKCFHDHNIEREFLNLDVSTLASGSYLIRIKNGHTLLGTDKFIKF
jgi:photosystem II stability/assembly factor-like uncharacterized protein